jgi:hypothetical protein
MYLSLALHAAHLHWCAESLVVFRHSNRCIPWVLNQCPHPVHSSSVGGPSTTKSWFSNTKLILLHCYSVRQEVYDCALRHHHSTSSSPSHSTHRPKPMAASWVHNISRHRINASEILVKNTQVHRKCCPSITSTNASFKAGRVSPSAICWAALRWCQAT